MPEQVYSKMNGVVPSVPITTLSGIASLSDLLPEMPLPVPIPQTLNNKSLLFHPRVADEAQILLSMRDETLVPQLIMSLSQTSSDHIELKDHYAEQQLQIENQPNTPELLKAILQISPNIFKPGSTQYHSPRNWSIQHQQQQLSSSASTSGYSPHENFSPYMNPQSSPAHQNRQQMLPGGIPHTQHPRVPIAPQNHAEISQTSPFTVPSPSSRSSVITSDQTRMTPQHIMEDASCITNLAAQFNMHSPGHLSSPASLVSSIGSITPQHHGMMTPQHNIHMTPPTEHQIHHSQQYQPHLQHTPSHQQQIQQPLYHQQQQMYDPMQLHRQMQQSIPPQSMESQHHSIHDNQQYLLDQVSALPDINLSMDTLEHSNNNPMVNLQQTPQMYHNDSHSIESIMQSSHSQIHASSYDQNNHQMQEYHQQQILHQQHEQMTHQMNEDPFQQLQDQSNDHQMQEQKDEQASQGIGACEMKLPLKEPVIMLNRSLADQVLMKKGSQNNITTSALEKSTRRASANSGSVISRNEETIKSDSESEDDYVPDDKNKSRKQQRSVQRDKRAPTTPKRKRIMSDEDDNANKKDEAFIPVKPKIRKFEKKLIPVLPKLSIEELMETNTYHKFNMLLDNVFDNTEEATLVDEDEDVPSELLIAEHHLHALCSEAAKLKSLNAMESVPADKLVRLLNILEKNIRDGAKVTPLADPDDDVEQSRMWAEIAMSRVQQALDASLVCLHIMTSSNMPKTIYLEDVIDRIILFMKFQLSNTIYPSYDPVYRVDSNNKKGKGGKNENLLNSSIKKKRSNIKEVREKNILLIYNKMHELVALLSELLNIQILTDTSVLHASSLGVAPFFVENVSDLQLSALKLVTVIFTKYEKHRRLLLDDILASIARLPSSKRSLRTYRLNSEEYIQMLTALVLQLIQCVVVLPDSAILSAHQKMNPNSEEGEKIVSNKYNIDVDVLILSKYEAAKGVAGSFLKAFLNKCSSKASDEVDYRPLFENFVQDLLATVNKPEWPAAELMLSLLGSLLVSHFSNKSSDMPLRTASIDYLGVVAARLRKDAVISQCKLSTIDQIINDIKLEQQRDSEYDSFKDTSIPGLNEEEERYVFLQKILLDYLAVNGTKDNSLVNARHFYLAQWYKDCAIEKQSVGKIPLTPSKKSHVKKKNYQRNKKGGRNRNDSDGESDEDSGEEGMDQDENDNNEQKYSEIYKIIEDKKKLIISKIRPYSSGTKPDILQTYIDYNSAELISQYLASKRPFSKSFDKYLQQILRVLTENAIAVRTKAMKCLAMIVEADPSVLARTDMQIGVKHSFLDISTSVREAAVDLVGKYVLSRPELIDKYYDKLLSRILDTGVSVRKRVIKILKDICIEYPDYSKIPEICVKMIRRVNDEEGIRKLVMEVFQNMWFTPVRERPTLDSAALLRKVMNITEVVAACKDIGLEWFEQLLVSLFKPKEDKDDSTKMVVEPPKALITACKQIVDCLIENVLRLDETNFNTQNDEIKTEEVKVGSSQRLVACLTTLYLFAKIRPQLLVNHAITLQPYLSLKCQTQADYKIISNVAHTLELVVPLMEHPSETFLAQLEEDSVKLILQHDRSVVASCLSCLGSIVNNVTKNYKLIRDCFNRYYGLLANYKWQYEKDPHTQYISKYRPFFRRALFTVGLLLRHFDFTDPQIIDGLPENIKDQVFDTLYYFVNVDSDETRKFTLSAIGSLCIRHYEFMMSPNLKELYHYLLKSDIAPLQMKIEVLNNIELYLQEEEKRMIKQDQEWSKLSKKENLKEMGDISSGMASTVIQIYLTEILESFLHTSVNVRHAALKVIQLILQQGLVHPVQIVPYLICMSTDCEKTISHSADLQLQDIEKKYPGFIHMKAQFGIKLSYKLQKILQGQESYLIRGMRLKEGEYPTALNGFLYTILRNTKQQRRAIVNSFLKQFEESAKTSLSQMLYLADNLAYFAYQVQDEPLFIIHHIDIIISVSGTNLLQSFKEALLPKQNQQQPIQQNALPESLQNLSIQPPQQDLQQKSMCSSEQQMLIDPQTGEFIIKNEINEFNNVDQHQLNQQQHEIQGVPMQQPVIEDEDDDDDDEEIVLARLPEDTTVLRDYITASQGFFLLLTLRQHLKDLYGFTDSKISQYSPSEAAKVYEKAVNRKTNHHFKPKNTLERLKENINDEEELDEEGRKKLVKEYLDFKQLMLKFDPDEPDEEDGEGGSKVNTSVVGHANTSSDMEQKPTHLVGLIPDNSQNTIQYQVHQVPEQPNSNNQNMPPRVPKLTIHASHHPHNNQHRKHRAHKVEKPKKHKKKKRRRLSDSSDSNEDDSDPDFAA